MIKSMRALALGAVAAMGIAGGVAASTCSLTDLDYSSACIGVLAIVGPPNGSADLTELNGPDGVLDGGGWSQLVKIEGNQTSPLFSMPLGSTSGTYTLFAPLAGYDYAIAVKGGSRNGTNFFAAYLLSASTIAANLSGADLTGAFNMAAFFNLAGNQSTPSLSNAVLFSRESVYAAPIPLPAAGWMLLAGIGGLAAWGRQGRAAA